MLNSGLIPSLVKLRLQKLEFTALKRDSVKPRCVWCKTGGQFESKTEKVPLLFPGHSNLVFEDDYNYLPTQNKKTEGRTL